MRISSPLPGGSCRCVRGESNETNACARNVHGGRCSSSLRPNAWHMAIERGQIEVQPRTCTPECNDHLYGGRRLGGREGSRCELRRKADQRGEPLQDGWKRISLRKPLG